MLPHKHFLIAAVAIVPASLAFYPEKSAIDTAKWAFAGGTLSAAMDLDVLFLVFLNSGKEPRLRRYRNIPNIFREFSSFKDTIAETGIMKKGLITHFITRGLLLAMSALLTGPYAFPVTIAVVSHLLSDLPNFRRLSGR